MSLLILNIDTAVESGSVCLSENAVLLKMRGNDNQKEHAAWIHEAINQIMAEAGHSLKDLGAVAVSNGPGSYTGLRIGLSAAKGLCYALQIPLITISTLEIMATSASHQAPDALLKSADLLCPMIDARRMEAYVAVFDKKIKPISPPRAVILEPGTFSELLQDRKMIFFGNGSHKLKNILHHPHAFFADFIDPGAADMTGLSLHYYKEKRFADLSSVEPLYIKDFYTPLRK